MQLKCLSEAERKPKSSIFQAEPMVDTYDQLGYRVKLKIARRDMKHVDITSEVSSRHHFDSCHHSEIGHSSFGVNNRLFP